jgi:cell division initiation protein
MRISALDIRQQQFTARMFRGLDPQEVEAFLENVAEDYENLVKENGILKQQLAVLEERSRNIVEHERTLQETLVTTHRLTEEMKQAAKREADMIVRDAEMRGEKVVDELRAEETRLKLELQSLKRMRRQLLEDLRGTVARYERLLTTEPAVETAEATDDDEPAS